MTIKFCALCERNIDPKRKIGVGSLILIIITAGFWILALPFYNKRCPICNGSGSTLHKKRIDTP